MLNLISDVESIFNNFRKTELPKVSLYAIGGFPFKISNETIYLLEKPIDKLSLINVINESLGLSGMMTYSNKSNFTLAQMGNKCKELNHFWGYNFITLSFLFVDLDPIVELSFLRNNTFYESWTVNNESGIYGMTGSIKDFKKFVSNKDDLSFDKPTREIMTIIHDNYSFLWK